MRRTVKNGLFLAACAALVMQACKARELSSSPATAHGLVEDEPPEKESTIAGSVEEVPFTHVASAFMIESPDSDAMTVIYLLSKPVRCVDLSFAEWERTLTSGTDVLELKILGKAPGDFLAVTSPALSPREATASFARTSVGAASREIGSSGGWIRLDTFSAQGRATGTFTLQFGAAQLIGTFDAAFCPGGHEP